MDSICGCVEPETTAHGAPAAARRRMRAIVPGMRTSVAATRAAKNASWQGIDIAGPVAKDKFCAIDFPQPVKAQALRLAIKLQKEWSGGILEWKIR